LAAKDKSGISSAAWPGSAVTAPKGWLGIKLGRPSVVFFTPRKKIERRAIYLRRGLENKTVPQNIFNFTCWF
jgi:hypothetical protein